MVSFTRYVLEHRGQDNKYGDVARDVALDPRVNTSMGYETLRACIARQQPEPVVLAILDEMYLAFREGRVRSRGRGGQK